MTADHTGIPDEMGPGEEDGKLCGSPMGVFPTSRLGHQRARPEPRPLSGRLARDRQAQERGMVTHTASEMTKAKFRRTLHRTHR